MSKYILEMGKHHLRSAYYNENNKLISFQEAEIETDAKTTLANFIAHDRRTVEQAINESISGVHLVIAPNVVKTYKTKIIKNFNNSHIINEQDLTELKNDILKSERDKNSNSELEVINFIPIGYEIDGKIIPDIIGLEVKNLICHGTIIQTDIQTAYQSVELLDYIGISVKSVNVGDYIITKFNEYEKPTRYYFLNIGDNVIRFVDIEGPNEEVYNIPIGSEQIIQTVLEKLNIPETEWTKYSKLINPEYLSKINLGSSDTEQITKISREVINLYFEQIAQAFKQKKINIDYKKKIYINSNLDSSFNQRILEFWPNATFKRNQNIVLRHNSWNIIESVNYFLSKANH